MIKYIYTVQNDPKKGSGVSQKIAGQVKALNNNGIETVEESHQKLSKIIRVLPLGTSTISWKQIDLGGIKGLYIRYPMADYRFVRFLKRAKESAEIVVCIEVPVYPYQKELKWYSLRTIREWIYRKFLHKYVDRVFYIGDATSDTKIFGVDSEKISNGIDFDSYSIHKRSTSDSTIRLIAVAEFQKSHGYERILKGMAEYKKVKNCRSVMFYMVGEGDEKKYYESLTEELELKDFVYFLGKLTGNELDEAYDKADIGVEVFGLYKRGIVTSSSLKSREYLARGLPFICGAPNDAIDGKFPYCLFFPNDSSVVDISKIVEFYDRIYNNSSKADEISKEIREYGINTVSWEKTMKPVSDFFKKNM